MKKRLAAYHFPHTSLCQMSAPPCFNLTTHHNEGPNPNCNPYHFHYRYRYRYRYPNRYPYLYCYPYPTINP